VDYVIGITRKRDLVAAIFFPACILGRNLYSLPLRNGEEGRKCCRVFEPHLEASDSTSDAKL
jgi:hypothetical protein